MSKNRFSTHFQFFKPYPAGIIWENWQLATKNISKRVPFFLFQTMCLQNNLLKRRSIGHVIVNKFKQVPLCKSVQVRTSANAFVGIVNWIIKRRSKVHQKSISRERTEQFQQWKRLFENHKPIRVWLWFVYKVIEDNPYLRLFAAFIHTQERSSTTLVKVVILTFKVLTVSVY